MFKMHYFKTNEWDWVNRSQINQHIPMESVELKQKFKRKKKVFFSESIYVILLGLSV